MWPLAAVVYNEEANYSKIKIIINILIMLLHLDELYNIIIQNFNFNGC